MALRLGGRKLPPPFPASKLGLSSVPPSPSDPHAPLRREYYTSADSGGLFRRFLQRRSLNQEAVRGSKLTGRLPFPDGAELRDQLKSLTSTKTRVRPVEVSPPSPEALGPLMETPLSLFDVKKMMRLARLERLKSEIRATSESTISYSDYLNICNRVCEDECLGMEFAKTLDESGDVVVFGNVVLLRPEQVAKSMEAILYRTTAMLNDPRRREFEQMEEHKSEIDRNARALVQTELYCGLGFLVVQTLGFMRLTFWEFTWDVMEPICFFVTSMHFALAYAFFLRTSTEPSFKGYFNQRFMTKQSKLMKAQNFDVDRYNKLRKVFNPDHGFASSGK